MNANALLDDLIERLATEVAARVLAAIQQAPTVPQNALAPTEYLTTRDAAKLLTLSVTTLESWRAKGKGPKWKRFGNAVRYARAELDRWAAANTRGSTK